MASKTKRTEARRALKDRPNKENLKKDQRRIARNREILKELAARETQA
jgi:hypothetical protein